MSNGRIRTDKKAPRAGYPATTPTEAKPQTPPVKPAYVRSPAELDLVSRQHLRCEQQSTAPVVTVQHKPPEPARIETHETDKNLWRAKFQAAMGTIEWSFADKLCGELINAACTGNNSQPLAGKDVNAALAAMHSIAPKDELEAMLAAQMIATHTAAMAVLRRLKNAENIPQQDSNGNLAAKL